MFMDLWSFNKKHTSKKVDENKQEFFKNLQEKITIYNRSRKIIDGKWFIKSYVDTRYLESMMLFEQKGTRFNLKVATKFDNIKVHSIPLLSSNEFLMSIDSHTSQYVHAGQKCAELLWSDNDWDWYCTKLLSFQL